MLQKLLNSAALPANQSLPVRPDEGPESPDGSARTSRIMPGHIRCFHISGKFVLSVSCGPWLDNLTNVRLGMRMNSRTWGIHNMCVGVHRFRWELANSVENEGQTQIRQSHQCRQPGLFCLIPFCSHKVELFTRVKANSLNKRLFNFMCQEGMLFFFLIIIISAKCLIKQ